MGVLLTSQNGLAPCENGDPYEPGENQGLIQVAYSGVSPADVKYGQQLGLNDRVTGYEFSGTVAKAGPGFPYAVGDEVFGLRRLDLGSRFGEHQDWLIAEGNSLLAKRPSTLPKDAAAGMLVALRTAVDALIDILGFHVLEITGSDSALGCAAIQIAKAAGVNLIIAITDPSYYQILLDLGAHRSLDEDYYKLLPEIRQIIDDHPEVEKMDYLDCKGTEFTTTKCVELRRDDHEYDEMVVSNLPISGRKASWIWCAYPWLGYESASTHRSYTLIRACGANPG
ncbi:uncharacterized protein SETTUDRAFT_155923 [Exserohilum turcica Et28A]|uniref:Alcohol dehydrogenase-like N-terminal domain-containing protein n=1 Tax=Exserohilum turcicum (strain 28A) TaxID=671987 RepID=R0IDE9_EXST2|nr:uncharacterized protein SETTUDRAFT_155923 [Exserohilum turcica Et28A]EOA83390.1 hypothetical protein SETTUDRAFT_155923 [Exserohilum turcica Et28A]